MPTLWEMSYLIKGLVEFLQVPLILFIFILGRKKKFILLCGRANKVLFFFSGGRERQGRCSLF